MITATFFLSNRAETTQKIDRVLNRDGFEEKFFVLWSQDCAFPVFALVRADNFQDAYEIFLNGCESWISLDENDVAEYQADFPDCWEDLVQWNDNGTPVYTEVIQGSECKSVNWFAKQQ